VLAFGALVGAKLWRRFAPQLGSAADQPRLVYRAELDRLSELGFRRAKGESRESFARRVSEAFPALVALTHAHVGAAFGSRRASSTPLDPLCDDLRRQRRAAVPLWRRVLGALDPFSWLLTR